MKEILLYIFAGLCILLVMEIYLYTKGKSGILIEIFSDFMWAFFKIDIDVK